VKFTGEALMVEASEEALKKIKQFLAEQEGIKPIRIFVTEGGWRGPYLVMGLDDPKETDQVFTEAGVTFIMEKTLLDKAKSVKIDYVHSAMGSGYTLNSDLLKDLVEGCETNICETCYPHS
jgi:Fe-S cluster assembly iron-binding protein IscA